MKKCQVSWGDFLTHTVYLWNCSRFFTTFTTSFAECALSWRPHFYRRTW